MDSLLQNSNIIVVGVDFSEPSRHALEEAIRIARGCDARVFVVHYLYDEEMAHFKRWNGIKESDVVAGRRTHLATWLSESRMDDVDVQLRVEVGHPFAEIREIVESENAKLLVLGAQGENHEHHGDLVGSVAKSCLRHPSTDLLLVRKSHREPFKNVLVAIDFSENSKLAVHRAAEVAKSDGADLHVVHIFSPVWKYYERSEEVDAAIEEHVSGLRKQFCDFAYSELQEVKQLPVHFDVRESFSAYNGIVEYANEVFADLIVVGHLGRGIQQLVSPGRTTERVIEKSNCSVLTVFQTSANLES